MITKVLCVCKGNSDRSPFMAAVLQMYLKKDPVRGEVCCESAGILEIADSGGGASPFMVKVARLIGIDLLGHKKRWIGRFATRDSLFGYDLFICVDDEVAAYVLGQGVDMKKIYNAQISNPWPSQFQRDYDDTAETIMGAMLRVVTRYFSNE